METHLPLISLLLVLGVPLVLGVTGQSGGRQTVQIEIGEDVFLPCQTPANAQLYIWERDNRTVESYSMYRENRVFVVRGRGVLILNTEQLDSGIFRCSSFSPRDGYQIQEYDLRIVASEEPDRDAHVIECGYVKKRSRVVGGRQVNAPGLFPWMVLLWHNTGGPFCGGSLLSRRYVVTAAHCFTQTRHDADQVVVRLGEFNTSSSEDYEKTVGIEELIIHPDYNSETYESDIMLIRLAEPVVFSDYIVPICLPSELRGERLLETGTRGTVAGWGTTEEGTSQFSNILKKAKLTIRDFETCQAQHSSYTITMKMFCALGGNNPVSIRDACKGDSGGPFIAEVEQRSYLVGIVSWGDGCGHVNRPGVYTRVSRFRSWILTHINSDLQTCEENSFQTKEDLDQEQSRIEALEAQIQDLNSQIMMYESQPEPTACTTPAPPVTTIAPYEDTPIPCRHGTCYHVGGYRVWGQCINGQCACNAPLYNRVTCLPSVGTCSIRENDRLNQHATALDQRASSPLLYTCVGEHGRDADVHVLAVYEGSRHTRPPTAGNMNVNISSTSSTSRPVVLVFANYEPVIWAVNFPTSLSVVKVVLISYYVGLSDVTFSDGIDPLPQVERKPRTMPRGYGKDRGGGNTAGMMARLSETYGSITSFAGTYRAVSWNWTLPVGHQSSSTSSETEGASGSSSGTSSANVGDTWTEFSFRSDNSWNSCRGAKYVRRREIEDGEVGQYIGVALCSNTRYKLFMSDDLEGTFQNIGDTSGHGQDHCEFVGAPSDGDFTLDSSFWYSPSTTGYYRSRWGDAMQQGVIGGGMGSSWTGRYYPKWYECGVTIP